MNTERLQLCDMPHIENIRNKYKHYSSSHAFASIYIWQEELGLTTYIEEDMFVVKYNTGGSNTWFFPCGSRENIIKFIKNIDKNNLRFCYMREEDVDFLRDTFPGMFEITEKDSDHEYLYSCEEWQNLKGTSFAGIRNHISRACRDNELSVEEINDNNIDSVKGIVRQWKRESLLKGDSSDNMAAQILADNFYALNGHGIVVYVNDVLFAVVAGFPLSENCFDMCLAKQSNRLSGLSVYAKYQFVKNLPKQYEYFNAEEDLGIEGLRTMKNQMKPIGLLKMFEGRICSDVR